MYGGGTITVGDTVTGSAGGTATVTNVQYTANKVYVVNATGSFALGNTLAFTSGGTGTVSAGALENQKGFVLICDGFSATPTPGQSISIAGDAISYVIQSVSGTYVNSASNMVIVLAQEKTTGSANDAAITLRSKYSQIRLTGHDFLSIGTGGTTTTNYPGIPTQPAAQGNEEVARPWVWNRELELLGLFILTGLLELATNSVSSRSRCGLLTRSCGARIEGFNLAEFLAKAIF